MANKNGIWDGYQPPKGRCNYKTSLLTSCTCLRFMLHPVKATTSFECDGCAHHASFHSLENPAEDAILKKWAEQQATAASIQTGTSKKRKLLTARSTRAVDVLELIENDESLSEDVPHLTR